MDVIATFVLLAAHNYFRHEWQPIRDNVEQRRERAIVAPKG
jgi:hypothetical protein